MNGFLVALLILPALIYADDRTRIIGGNAIDISEAPYTVQVFALKRVCVGSILSTRFVATAAHCISQGMLIIAGTSTMGGQGQMRTVKLAIKHPDYQRNKIGAYNDYGLLVLKDPLVFGTNVGAISLAQEDVPALTMMMATGWGLTENNAAANSLREVSLPTIDDEECKTLFDGETDKSILCAGYMDQAKSIAKGDSGGPLVFNNTLYGISSFSDNKGPSYPSGFARVSVAYNWFKEEMERN